MLVIGEDNRTRTMPLIWRNKIDSSGLDGIFVYGPICEPDIRGNIITSNRKAGIKFTN